MQLGESGQQWETKGEQVNVHPAYAVWRLTGIPEASRRLDECVGDIDEERLLSKRIEPDPSLSAPSLKQSRLNDVYTLSDLILPQGAGAEGF